MLEGGGSNSFIVAYLVPSFIGDLQVYVLVKEEKVFVFPDQFKLTW